MQSTTTLLGIDPGYDRLGWAVGEKTGQKIEVKGYGCIQTDKKQTLIQRYSQIIEQLDVILEQYQPTVCVIESLFFFKNQKTALKVAEARGVIINSLLRKQISINELTPLQIKQAVTGYGRADKQAIEKMVRLQLKLPKEEIIDDTLDALGMLMTV